MFFFSLVHMSALTQPAESATATLTLTQHGQHRRDASTPTSATAGNQNTLTVHRAQTGATPQTVISDGAKSDADSADDVAYHQPERLQMARDGGVTRTSCRSLSPTTTMRALIAVEVLAEDR